MEGRIAQRGGRLPLVIGASIALHAGLLAVLALQKPPASRMVAPALIEVTIAPLYLVEPQARQRRDGDRIRPRAARPLTGPLPVAPLYAAPTPPAPPTSGRWRVQQATDGAAQLSQALRRGGLGCPQGDLVGLSPSEREACQARLAAGAKTAAYLGQGLDAAKQKGLDLAAGRKAAYLRYRDAPIPPGLSTSNAAGGIAGLGEVPAVSQTPR